jgi:predicted transcriptional regulator
MTEHESAGSASDPFQGAHDENERRDIDLLNREYNIYRCTDCSNVVLSMQDCDGGMTCHGDAMEQVEQSTLAVREPDIRQVLLDAFGLPKAGLDICLCVIGDGPLSPGELADQLDYEEATVRRYLNELVEFGLLQKSQLNRESGGFVNVYHSTDLDQMREDTLVGFYTWAGEAASLIEEANLTKKEYQNTEYNDGLNEVFWERFSSDGAE